MGWLSDLIVRVKGDSTHLDGTLNKTKSSVGGWAKKVAGLFAAAFGVKIILNFAKEIIGLASKTEGIKIAFDNLNQPTLLDDLRTATRGTVTDLELMQKAVQAKNFKIPLDQLATYFEFATKRAIQTGESVDYLVESIITGIGRKSVMIMDNLGISSVALQDEIKKTGDFASAAGNIVQRELKDMGTVADTTAIKIAKLKTTWENFKVSLGETVTATKGFQTIMQWLEDMSQMLSDERLTGWQKFLSNPDEYKVWKKQEEDRRSEWRKTLSVYDDTELAIRKGRMVNEEYNRQINLEIKERAKLARIRKEDLEILHNLNDHTQTYKKTIAEAREEIKTLTSSLEGLTGGEGIQSEKIRQQITNLEKYIDSIINFREKLSSVEAPKAPTGHLKPASTVTAHGQVWGQEGEKTIGEIAGIQEFNTELTREITKMEELLTSARDMAAELGFQMVEALGEALGGGEVKELGKGLLMSLANFLSQFGRLLLVMGLGMEAFVKSLESLNPWVAIAAGTAMLVAAGAIRGLLSSGGKSVSTGTASAPSSSYGSSYAAQGSMKTMTIKIEGELHGRDIYWSGKRYAEDYDNGT